MIQIEDTQNLYQLIGEFVVAFQWLEHRFRQIGWLIHNPDLVDWPPLLIREESNFKLVEHVHHMFSDLMDAINTKDSAQLKESFALLVQKTHQLRSYKNILLQTAFMELKARNDILSIADSKSKIKAVLDPDYAFDPHILTLDSIKNEINNLEKIAFSLNNHYLRAIHWLPYKTG